jgi:hypothetical protein
LHAGSDLVERKNVIGLCEGSDWKKCDCQREAKGAEEACGQMERGRQHELIMILGAGTKWQLDARSQEGGTRRLGVLIPRLCSGFW